MIDETNNLNRVLSNSPFSSYAVATASIFAGAAICAREWLWLSEKITSIALSNLGASSLCRIQSIYPNYPLLQQPAMLDHPELEAVIHQCSSDLLQEPGILEHPNIELILEKGSYIDHLLYEPEILKHPNIELILEKCSHIPSHLLKQPGILEHPQIALILEKSSPVFLDHLLKQPKILEHPNFELILARILSDDRSIFINDLLKLPGILEHPKFEFILSKSFLGSADHFLHQPGILEHPKIELILEKSSFIDHLLKLPGILEHPKFELILSKSFTGSTDHFLQLPGILEHPKIGLILEKSSRISVDYLLKQPRIFEHPKIELIANHLLKYPEILQHPKIAFILEKSSCGSTNHFHRFATIGHPNKELILEKIQSLRAVANLPCDGCGMFSVFHYLLGLMRDHETSIYSGGIEINFGNKGLYYDPTRREENWWNYYFEPVNIVKVNHNKCADQGVQFDNNEYGRLANSIEGVHGSLGISRKEANALFKKYFKLESGIQAEVDRFAADHFSEAHVISVHYRGTDKSCNGRNCEARKVTYEEMIENVQKYIRENNLETFKIFVAADEEGFVQKMREEFPGKIAVSKARRSTDGQPLHFNTKNPYETGREALIDCLLLARGEILIRTSSNLSKFATYINPDMQVIEVSKRWYQDKK